MGLFWKLLAKVYTCLFTCGIALPPSKRLFHQPLEPLPYTYIETLHADVNFDPLERELILQAAHDWEYFANGFFKIEIVFDLEPDTSCGQDGKIFKVAAAHEDVVKADGYHKTTIYGLCAYWTMKSGFVRRELLIVSERLENPLLFKMVVVHELGHYIWLSHIKGHGVMYDYINGNVLYPTLADAKEYESKFDIDIANLRYFLG
jgi:hypothetical protein